MKKIYFITVLLLVGMLTYSQDIAKAGKYNPEKVNTELIKKYKDLNGPLAELSVELWDTYFLNNPNIGNLHEGRHEIGWERFHDQSVQFASRGMEGELLTENIVVYPINSNTAWVKGDLVMVIDGRRRVSNFFDALTKTVEGWRVFMSVVYPVKPEFKVDKKILEKYAGKYEIQPGFNIDITLEDGKMMFQVTGQDKMQIFAESETKFEIRGAEADIEFVLNETGEVKSLFLIQGERKNEAKKK